MSSHKLYSQDVFGETPIVHCKGFKLLLHLRAVHRNNLDDQVKLMKASWCKHYMLKVVAQVGSNLEIGNIDLLSQEINFCRKQFQISMITRKYMKKVMQLVSRPLKQLVV